MTASGEGGPPYRLFDVFGIEIEYAIVDADSLSVLPVSDALLETLAGEPASDVEFGRVACSNELVLHVVELKTAEPAPSLEGLAADFGEAASRVSSALAPLGARLMPTAMHPFMDPATETHLWPHDNNAIYGAFDRIFDCKGHGWSNLQSIHVNLPFDGDVEFARLHAAIRLLLPLLPALAASSPLVEGRATGWLDNRLEFYRNNSRRLPSVAGRVIPEDVGSRREYETVILEEIARDLAPWNQDGILEPEWTNARGAIARFSRGSIEIRVLDSQECPAADLAVAAATVAVARALTEERWTPYEEQRAFEVAPLAELFLNAVHAGRNVVLEDPRLAKCFGVDADAVSLAELWQHLVGELIPPSSEFRPALETLTRQGCLSERILRRVGSAPSRRQITEVYRELCDCLVAGRLLE